MATRFALLAVLSALDFAEATPHPLSDEFISLINSKQNAWQAGRNFPQDTPLEYIKRLAGVLPHERKSSLPVIEHHPDLIASLPERFDPREKWTNCTSLNEIRDQGYCGSCWAFGAVEAMTDRYCIFSKESKQVHISAEDLLSCCHYCGDCDGSMEPISGWQYCEKTGLITGGNYKSKQGCRPYTPQACEHFVLGNRPKCKGYVPTPQCVKKCEDGYDIPYEQDKHHGKNIATINGEEHIMAELYQNGPVEASFTVYADWIHYKSGVYIHTEGVKAGEHSVKLMGWGVENGHKYWLIANSFNSDWGDNGFFKILRGEDHCGIESEIITGEPVL